MLRTLKVGDVKCKDDGQTRGIDINCAKPWKSCVSLVFDPSTPQKQVDELSGLLEKMKLIKVTVEI